MVTFQQFVNRRTFLKIIANLPVVVSCLYSRCAFADQSHTSSSVTYGYGVGSYSQGEYPGYETYLPLVSKENK